MSARDILAAHGVAVLSPAQRSTAPRQTYAIETFERILDRHGADHVHDVLTSILESENNGRAFKGPIISAVSRLHLAHRQWFERDASAWLSVFDEVDLLALYAIFTHDGSPVSPADGVAACLSAKLWRVFEPGDRTLFDWMG